MERFFSTSAMMEFLKSIPAVTGLLVTFVIHWAPSGHIAFSVSSRLTMFHHTVTIIRRRRRIIITVSATKASMLLDPEYGMLYLQNSDMTSALDSLGAN